MELQAYIDANYDGVKAAFARAMDVDPQQVTKWIKGGWCIEGGKLCSPRRDLPDFPIAHSLYDTESEKRFPLYAQYPNEFQPQPAFISLDLRTGEIDARINGEVGNAIPMDVYHNQVLRYPVSHTLRHEQIVALIDNGMPKFQAVLAGADANHWDGSNYVGCLNKDAEKASEQLEAYLDTANGAEPISIIDDLGGWLNGDCFGDAFDWDRESAHDLAIEILSCDGMNNCYFADSLNTPERITDAVLELWADQLYCGETLPQYAAQELVRDGRCEDSAWMDELKEFAEDKAEG